MKPSTKKPSTSNHPAFALLLLGVLLLLLALLPQPALADPGWYNPSWEYRKSITIAHDQVEGDLSNFPVLISFTDTDLRDDAQNDGNDILFTSPDEATKLKHWIEEFVGGTGKLIAWVNVISLSHSADTTLYMYYNNSQCGSQQNPTGVWDTNYEGVWHLLGGAGTDIPDSTSNSNAGTKQAIGHLANTVSGQIDGAQVFDGDDYVAWTAIKLVNKNG